jgi:NTE family protein
MPSSTPVEDRDDRPKRSGALQRLSASVAALLVPLVAGLILGCATARIENKPLEKYEPGRGYGETYRGIPHDDKLRVILAFSGGGTRAAALAYGVLKEIRDTKVLIDGVERRLIDQVGTISSVSGGSFTSAYYGLNGEQIFEDFEDKFLRRNFDGKLAINLFRPIKLMRMMLTPYTRSDMAVDLYDKEIFKGATFADLETKPGPLLEINATDIAIGAVFTFVQSNFNMICSDLSKLRVAQAVTASSAVPGVFSPLLLENHAGECGFDHPAWMQEALAHRTTERRRYHQARVASTYFDSEDRPYVYLVDGGVADNIGARRILANVIQAGNVENLVREEGIEIPRRILYIIVNAQAGGHHHKHSGRLRRPSIPSAAQVLGAISGTGIYRYNFETIELLRESAQRWSLEEEKRGSEMTPYVAEVAFDSLQDRDEREFFNQVKTSFKLDDETIDRLIEVGGRLLRETPEFQQFLADMK